MTDIHIPPEALEAAARSAANDRGYNWELHPNFHKAFKRMARAALQAGLAAWPGMEISGIGGGHLNVILPLTENADAEA